MGFNAQGANSIERQRNANLHDHVAVFKTALKSLKACARLYNPVTSCRTALASKQASAKSTANMQCEAIKYKMIPPRVLKGKRFCEKCCNKLKSYAWKMFLKSKDIEIRFSSK